MYIAHNLQYLRKRDGITQEDLADKLNVSRQSVSKWETGEAYPETDKLLALCEIFDVSLDALMRSDLTGAPKQTDGESEQKPDEPERPDNARFVRTVDAFSRAIAAGVALILLGVALCVVISGYAQTLVGKNAELISVLAGACVIVFVAAAVFLFVFFGMSYDRFRKRYPKVDEIYSQEKIDAFGKKFAVAVALLVSGILIDVVYLIIMSALIGNGMIAVTNKDETMCYVTAGFLFVLALAVGGLVYFGIQRSKYYAEEYNKQQVAADNPRAKLASALCGSIMLTATAVFLLLGFVWGLWHPGWVVFPIGGIACAIVNTIINSKEK